MEYPSGTSGRLRIAESAAGASTLSILAAISAADGEVTDSDTVIRDDSDAAVMLALPALTPVANPDESMVAIAVLLDDHVTDEVISAVLESL